MKILSRILKGTVFTVAWSICVLAIIVVVGLTYIGGFTIYALYATAPYAGPTLELFKWQI